MTNESSQPGALGCNEGLGGWRTALEEALSVCQSVHTGRDRRVVRDGCVLYLQTEEWCKWAEEEVAPKLRAALAAAPEPSPVSMSAEEADFMRLDLKRSCQEVFDTKGSETPQAVREVIEYVDSWLAVYLQKRLDRAAGTKPLNAQAERPAR